MEDKENINTSAKARYENRRTAVVASKMSLSNLVDRLNKFSNMLLPQLGMAMDIPSKKERRNTKRFKNK